MGRPTDPGGARTHDQHHVVCRRCGRTEDVDCAVRIRPCLDPSTTAGFVVDEAEIAFWGLCPDCSTTPCPADGPSRQ